MDPYNQCDITSPIHNITYLPVCSSMPQIRFLMPDPIHLIWHNFATLQHLLDLYVYTCFFHLYRRQLGSDVTAKLVTALVLLRLDHCNAVLVGLPVMTLAQSLACSSRYCSRLRARRPCHSWFAGVALVADHRENTVQSCACLCSRCRRACSWLHCQPVDTWPSLHSSSNCDLVIPRTSLKIGDRAFSVASPRAWNWLPIDLKLLH